MDTARAEQRSIDRQRSFERLYRRHRADVFRLLLRDVGNPQDAEDLTQVAFLNAYRALQRGAVPERPWAWLHAIAENAGRKRFMRERRRPREVALDPDLLIETATDDAVTVQDLRAALEALPENQRRVLLLREVQGLAYTEIAEKLHLSVASVQMLLFRARRGLRGRFAGSTRSGLAIVPLPGWLVNAFGATGSSATEAGLAGRAAAVVAVAVLGVGVAAETGVSPVAHARRVASPLPASGFRTADRPSGRPGAAAPARVQGAARVSTKPMARPAPQRPGDAPKLKRVPPRGAVVRPALPPADASGERPVARVAPAPPSTAPASAAPQAAPELPIAAVAAVPPQAAEPTIAAPSPPPALAVGAPTEPQLPSSPVPDAPVAPPLL